MNTSVNINLDTKGFSEKRLERIKNEISTEGFTDGTPNESFEGPSLYFSMEALKSCRKDFFGERHIEMVYATLVAWGMHRTGKGESGGLPAGKLPAVILPGGVPGL